MPINSEAPHTVGAGCRPDEAKMLNGKALGTKPYDGTRMRLDGEAVTLPGVSTGTRMVCAEENLTAPDLQGER